MTCEQQQEMQGKLNNDEVELLKEQTDMLEDSEISVAPDPLIESVSALQSIQEALEHEVQKFAEMSKVDSQLEDSNIPSSEMLKSANSGMQYQALTSRIGIPRQKLEDYAARKHEPESSGDDSFVQKFQKGEQEIEQDMERTFRDNVAFEYEHLLLTQAVEDFKEASSGKIADLSGGCTFCDEARIQSKLDEAKIKSSMLRQQTKRLEKCWNGILETEKVLDVQNMVLKATSFFVIEVVLLVVVFWLLFLQLQPGSDGVIPT